MSARTESQAYEEAEFIDRQWSVQAPTRNEEIQASLDTIVVRLDEPADWRALCRLAALDARAVPHGRLLVAVVGREIVAAVPVDRPGDAINDPFRPTSFVVELLELRANQIRRAQSWPHLRPLPDLVTT